MFKTNFLKVHSCEVREKVKVKFPEAKVKFQ